MTSFTTRKLHYINHFDMPIDNISHDQKNRFLCGGDMGVPDQIGDDFWQVQWKVWLTGAQRGMVGTLIITFGMLIKK